MLAIEFTRRPRAVAVQPEHARQRDLLHQPLQDEIDLGEGDGQAAAPRFPRHLFAGGRARAWTVTTAFAVASPANTAPSALGSSLEGLSSPPSEPLLAPAPFVDLSAGFTGSALPCAPPFRQPNPPTGLTSPKNVLPPIPKP